MRFPSAWVSGACLTSALLVTPVLGGPVAHAQSAPRANHSGRTYAARPLRAHQRYPGRPRRRNHLDPDQAVTTTRRGRRKGLWRGAYGRDRWRNIGPAYPCATRWLAGDEGRGDFWQADPFRRRIRQRNDRDLPQRRSGRSETGGTQPACRRLADGSSGARQTNARNSPHSDRTSRRATKAGSACRRPPVAPRARNSLTRATTAKGHVDRSHRRHRRHALHHVCRRACKGCMGALRHGRSRALPA
jgi:hypothetical protein